MNPREAVEYLYGLKKQGFKTGFERTEHLLEELGNPHREFQAVQVGGTNGKGSTAALLDSCFRMDGRSVGLYTSPHIRDLGERVRVDGERMRWRSMRDFVGEVRPIIEEMDDTPSFFEVTSVMAFYEFARRDVDIAVLEVGLGGRYDTTSVCDASVAAITSLDLEHTDVLGDTVEDIAWEVGHVIPEDGVCVTAAENALDVLRGMADDRDADLRVVGEDVTYTDRGREEFEQVFDAEAGRSYGELRTGLLGRHQVRNAAVAVGVLEELGVGTGAIRRGLSRAEWPGRFEVMQREPLVVLDAAHNPAGTESLVDTLGDFRYDNVHVVFGALDDKDVDSMAARLSDIADGVKATAPSKPRAMEAREVKLAFEARGVDAEMFQGVLAAVESALDDAAPGDAVVVTGSLYVVGEARRSWTERGLGRSYSSVDRAADSLEGLGSVAASYSSSAVHRCVRLSGLTPEDARELSDAAHGVGAEAVVSTRVPGMYVDVEVLATLSQHQQIGDEIDSSTLREELLNALEVLRGDTDVMGILNVTPDSFYDGGRYEALEDAVERGLEMAGEGADLIDVGGESTRPGAEPVEVEEEIERIVPVIERLGKEIDVPISVDTRHPYVAREALDAGAEIVNDVSGLGDPEMRKLVAERDCRVVIMDSVDVPVDPNRTPVYDDVVRDVADRLLERVAQARRAGVDPDDIILDPGIGFGKGKEGDAELLARTDELASLGYPLLIGCSRKSFIEGVLDAPEEERLEPSIAANVLAAWQGASIVRVHDVKETVKAVRVADALLDYDS